MSALLSRLRSLGRNLLGKARVERELHQEVEGFLDELTDEKVAAGMSREAARHAARVEIGGAEQVKERVREVRAGARLDELLQDLRYGLRTLGRERGFTTVAVLALALGIGANTAIFSVVYGILLRPLPFPEADHLAMVYMRFAPQGMERGPMSLADFQDWRAANHAFVEPSLFSNGGRFDLVGAGDPEQVMGASVSAGFFSTLGARPLLGRVFAAGEDAPTTAPMLVLGESLWRRRFGADPAVVGRPVQVNGTPSTVIGVMPAAFRFPRADSEAWTNLRLVPPTRRGPFFYRGLARLRPGVTLERAQAETNEVGRRIEAANPGYSHLTLPVVPLQEALVGRVRPALLVMLGAVVLVLLIAAVNVANLLLARAASRQREMAIRIGLGAGRGRLVRQLLTESVLLALAGGAAGLMLAQGGVRLLQNLNPGNLPRVQEVQLDGSVLAFAGLVSLLTGLLFGLLPALQTSRPDPGTALREGSRGGTASPGRRRTHAVLVVAEVALSLVLLVGAGLLLRSFVRLQRVETGVFAPARNVVTLQISPSPVRYGDDAAGIAFYERLMARMRELPGIEAVALGDSLPPDRQNDADTFVIEGQDPAQVNPAVTVPVVSPDYFRALGIPLRRGRFFSEGDTAASPPVAILSESMARRCFGDADPVGLRIKQSGPSLASPYMEIVGVVGDLKYQGLDSGPEAAYYLPFRQSFTARTNLLVLSATDASGLGESLAREVRDLDPEVVVGPALTLEQALSQSVVRPRFNTLLIGLFAAIALLLAAIGLYGVIAYSVAQRSHEIGVRMALGACRGDVLRLVIGQGAVLAGVGIAVGLAGAFAVTRWLGSLLFSVSATDPATYAGVTLLLAGVALLASLVPAARATRIDPLLALRVD
jgi:putative ABC transport system permease protein